MARVTDRIRLDEFLVWDDGTQTRYEIIDGFPLPIPLLPEAGRILKTRLMTRIDAVLASRRPARVEPSPGLIPPYQADTFLVADLAATAAPIEAWRQEIVNAFLIVEILSPSTERHDRRVKLPVYRQIDRVQEILFIGSNGIYAELHRRAGRRWITEIMLGGEAVLNLASVPIEIRLGELYDGIALPDSED
jgi:Uma2 family endonuclease